MARSITYARELFEYESKETERLETRIARQTRHCVELSHGRNTQQDIALFSDRDFLLG
jgi:hypothetical protein